MYFSDKVVIITGASSGIGAAASLMFANQAANLVLVGRNEASLKDVAAKCETASKIKPLIVKADVSVDDDVKSIINRTIETFGRIDVLVNNAGVGIRGGIRDGIELFDRAMATNVRPVYLLISLAIPHLVKTKGNIVNVSSVAAFKPIPFIDFAPYCTSKAALDMVTKCAAKELAKDGVRVNSVNPGATKTPFVQAAGLNEEQAEDLYKILNQRLPLGKMAESEEVADLILFLASSRAQSMTGSICVVDNGEILL